MRPRHCRETECRGPQCTGTCNRDLWTARCESPPPGGAKTIKGKSSAAVDQSFPELPAATANGYYPAEHKDKPTGSARHGLHENNGKKGCNTGVAHHRRA